MNHVHSKWGIKLKSVLNISWAVYNQVPHLPDMGKWQKHKKHHKQKSQDASPFQAGNYKAEMNRQDRVTKTNMKRK